MNKFEKVLLFAKTKGLTELSCKELFDMQKEAFELTPAEVAEVDKILENHGWSRKQWTQVLQQSGSFYFCPNEEQDVINKEIMKYLSSIGRKFQSNYSMGVFSGHLKNVIDQANSKIGRRHDGKVFKYYLL